MSSDWDFRQIRSAVDSLEKEYNAAMERAKEITGTIQKLEPYVWHNFQLNSSMERWFKKNWYDSYQRDEPRNPEAWRKLLDDLMAQNKEIRQRNLPIIQSNTDLLNRLMALIKAMGVPEKEYMPVPKSRSGKKDWFAADWTSIRKFFPMGDAFSEYERRYNEALRLIGEYEKKREQEDLRIKREEEQKIKKRESDIEFARLLIELDLPSGSGPCRMLEVVLSKNKYLHLAHYLAKNRGDWSDGPSYAEQGLYGFDIENPKDKEIYDCIRGYISDWDGDGRVFRDCEWNYGVIFDMVPPELMKTYEKVMSLQEVEA